MKRIAILTGATGGLGQAFLHELLREDIDEICRREGFVNLTRKNFGSGGVGRFMTKMVSVCRILTTLHKGDILFLQYPMKKFYKMACTFAQCKGAKVVTISGPDGYIYDPDGIDRAKLDYIMELKNVYRGRIREYVEEYPTAKYVGDGAKPWFEKADIACPCATQNELNEEAAKALVANGVIAVAEGANMPSTPEAIRVFQEAKILYSPGKASNAGGVSVSGLEMSQNSERLSWSSEEVDKKLLWIMENIHDNCVKYGTEADGYVNYVKGANVAGFMKVAKAMMAQGIV